MRSLFFFLYQLRLSVLLALCLSGATWALEETGKAEKVVEKEPAKESPAEPVKEKEKSKKKAEAPEEAKEPAAPVEEAEQVVPGTEGEDPATADDADGQEVEVEDEVAAEAAEAEAAAVARPVSPDMVQVYGWRESIIIEGMEKPVTAKLDTGAYTSSIHAEEKELFERDGKKWVRFIVTEPRKKDSPRVRIEAPLVRIARIKEPGGESVTREVVRLAFKIGERKLRGEFNLNNRSNMLAPVLIGRTTVRQLGWIDPSRTNLADDKVMR